ncbi:hemolysin family protein [Canibacter zhoujuaniae]|uniref:hemolysin family protein n=1 Tax=Canibacter zhoujuaniae TaxID=2708343 RepID=UPI00141FFDE5|nr:hemolysin family protein [Canibacter zhoujuaniae]
MNEWLLLIIGIVLTFGTGVFVAAEFSLVALDRHELERQQAAGEKRLGPVIKALRITSTHLSSAQLGITLTTLLAGYTLEPAFSKMLSRPLSSLGVAENLLPVITVPVAVAVATLLSMIIGELVPKNFALAVPLATAKLVVPIQTAFTTIFKPAIIVLNGSANAMLRGIGIDPKEELSGARSAEELASLVRHSAASGVLEADTATLLDRTLHLSELAAADAMTPRLKMESVQRLEMVPELIELSGKTGFSRFPVIDEDRDDIVGVAHVKQAIAIPREKRGEVPVAAITEEVTRVPETMPLDLLLAELRDAVYQCAIVVDEYGGTAGFVTLEDLVEELIGEVADEHDRAQTGIIGSADKLLIPGELRPDELAQQSGVVIPESGEYDTVAGFMLSELGKIPVPGDEISLADGATLRVERMDGRRIARIRYQGPPLPEGYENGESTETGTIVLPHLRDREVER